MCPGLDLGSQVGLDPVTPRSPPNRLHVRHYVPILEHGSDSRPATSEFQDSRARAERRHRRFHRPGACAIATNSARIPPGSSPAARHAYEAAPFRRNDVLLNFLPKGFVAFPGSGITNNLIDKARKIGIPVLMPRRAGPRHHTERDRSLFCRFPKDTAHGGTRLLGVSSSILKRRLQWRCGFTCYLSRQPHALRLREIEPGREQGGGWMSGRMFPPFATTDPRGDGMMQTVTAPGASARTFLIHMFMPRSRR